MQFSIITSLALLLASATAQPYLSERDADPGFKNFWSGVTKDFKSWGSGVQAGLSRRELIEARDPRVNWGQVATGAEKVVGTAAGKLFKAFLKRDPAFTEGFHAGYNKRDLEALDYLSALEARDAKFNFNSLLAGGLKGWGTVQGAAAKAFAGRSIEDVDSLYERDVDMEFGELDAREADDQWYY